MKHHRQLAAALACALAIGLGAGAVLATETAQPATPPLLIAPAPSTAPSASTDTAAEKTDQPVADADVVETEETPAPDPEGTLSFANLEQRVREGSLYYQIAQENVAYLEAYDFEKMQDDLRDALNKIANAQWQMHTSSSMVQIPGADNNPNNPLSAIQGALQGVVSMSTAATAQSLDAQYAALREQFDALKDGETQKEIADGIRATKNEQDKIVMQAQSTYVMLLEGMAGDATLSTTLAALDRKIAELEIRYTNGQVSAMQLQSLKATRNSLASQQLTIQASIKNGLMQMEALIGAEITGTLQLAPLPLVETDKLNTMDLEKDLAAAKAASYDLYAAKKVLDDADDVYEDSGAKHSYNEKKYEHVQARHTWQAAQHTYDATVQMFELQFRTLYNQVKDYQQVLPAAQTALAVQQDNYRAAQLKYEQGVISEYALLEAKDSLSSAQDDVNAAAIDLFTAYNNYCWAVERGILN